MLAAEQASRIQELAAQGNMSPQEIRAGMAPRYVNQDEDEFDQFKRTAAFSGGIPSLSPKEFDLSSMVVKYIFGDNFNFYPALQGRAAERMLLNSLIENKIILP